MLFLPMSFARSSRAAREALRGRATLYALVLQGAAITPWASGQAGAEAPSLTTAVRPVPAQPGRMEITYGPTVPEFTYTLEASSDLGATDWATLGVSVNQDDGETRSVVDYEAGGGRKFYRVRTERPPLGPFWNAYPPSTLLPAGATQVAFTVNTERPASCRYAVGEALPYAAMRPFDSGQGGTVHGVVFAGLNPDTTVVNEVYVRCDVAPEEVLHLRYRALPAANPSFPRKGNLWGSWKVMQGGGIERCARIDLWLGAAFTPAQIVQLRALNPQALVLDSINTVEVAEYEKLSIPDGYWLKDTSGRRIEVWNGAYRLNLTKPEVAAFQARRAYRKIVDADLATDGMFFDNFFETQSWLKRDMWGNPVEIDADEDGRPDDPAWFDAAWRAGVYSELRIWRRLMPHAYASGHLPDPPNPEFAALFNGDSLGFAAPQCKDGNLPFPELWQAYHDWWPSGRTPRIPMIESGPPFEIAYGYGYRPAEPMPPATLAFAQRYYPYMRFGLGVTLMNDGYFAHELGDTLHGNDWWYDELDVDLGWPLGPAVRLAVPGGPATDGIVNGGFEQALAPHWTHWANAAAGAVAVFCRDETASATGSASCRIEISNAGMGTGWHVALFQPALRIAEGELYDLKFFARANGTHPFSVGLQKGGGDWRNYGLYKSLVADTGWREYTVTFAATESAADARLSFNVGSRAGTFWVDEVRLVPHAPDVFRREFTNGVVLLNGTSARRTLPVEGGPWRRLFGAQAPKYQYVVDDAAPGFSAGGWIPAAYDSGQWVATGPWFHDWGQGCHESAGLGGSAEWDLGVRADDTYTVQAWWPAAPAAAGWSTQVRYEVLAGGEVVASAVLDQSTGGDQWHRIASVALSKAAGATVRITNLQARPAIADALLVESTARYNDGAPVSAVELDPFDAIVLLRE